MRAERVNDIVILGTGSLAYELVSALSTTRHCHFTVCIAGRDFTKASMLALLGNSRAQMVRTKVVFKASTIVWSHEGISGLLRKREPKIIVHLASIQSPWRLATKSEWSSLVKTFGFGITVPLQMQLLIKLAEVVKKEFPNTIILNACYPDVCNALLTKIGLEVFSGVGNVSILDSILRLNYKLDITESIDIIGHHFHVSQLISRSEKGSIGYPQVWINGKKVTNLSRKLSNFRLPSDSSLNCITALTIIPLLECILFNKEAKFNLPGPIGLPGGYPVLLKNRKVELSLPKGSGYQKAVQHNTKLSLLEGIAWTNNSIFLDERVIRYLRKNHPSLELFNKLNIMAA